MNLREMSYLVAVADLQSFSQAAVQCHVSQPTLSAQIKKLEEFLQVKIFERNNKRVMITEEGQSIVNSARRIVQEIELLQESAESAKNPLAGKFRLGAFPTLASYIFPDIVPLIHREMPDLRLILIEEKTAELVERLHRGEIDAILVAMPLDDASFEVHPLFNDPFLLAAPPSHPLSDRSEIELGVLADHGLLLLEEGHCLRDNTMKLCQQHQIPEELEFRATSLETLRQMVKAGTGITLMPEIAIGHADSGIAYIPIKAPAPFRTIGIAYRKTSTKKVIIEKVEAMITDARQPNAL